MADAVSWKAIAGRAYGILKSELGRQACAQGWQIQLYDFAFKHGRKPEGDEIAECRDRAYRIAIAKRGWPAIASECHSRKMQRFERIAYGLEPGHRD